MDISAGRCSSEPARLLSVRMDGDRALLRFLLRPVLLRVQYRSRSFEPVCADNAENDRRVFHPSDRDRCRYQHHARPVQARSCQFLRQRSRCRDRNKLHHTLRARYTRRTRGYGEIQRLPRDRVRVRTGLLPHGNDRAVRIFHARDDELLGARLPYRRARQARS